MSMFPEDFKFGVATAAYQVEGAWNVGGRSESMWDYQTHTFPDRIHDGTNGDVACDAYHKVDEDIKNLKDLKVNFYRFSISWSRLLPSGFPNKISEDGVRYYNEVIDKLVANKIEPMVTLYHWDLPQCLEDLGGWCNPLMADYFADYARVCFSKFGDRVKSWITINEPYSICGLGYGGTMLAPYYKSSGVGSYLSGHSIILGHAKAYRLYDKEFRKIQKGKVGITIESSWWEPLTDSRNDVEAAENMRQMYFGWFAHPIFSKCGDYPAVMRKRVDALSKQQGFTKSRLPLFTKEEIALVKGSYDFLGLNHYTMFLVGKGDMGEVPSNINDVGISYRPPEGYKNTARDFFKVVPWGIRKLLNWVKTNYDNPNVIITENGYAGEIDESLQDDDRVDYYNDYLKEILKAIHEDNCNVKGYTAWSYMDNYEWTDGYTMRFGLYHVDFNNPDRPRTPKKSAYVYQNIIVTRQIDENLHPNKFLH